MTQHQLIESTAIDIIAAIREHGPTRDVIVPRLEKLIKPMVSLLEDIESFLDDRADVDDGRPNAAMRLLTELREMIREAGHVEN